MKKKGIIYMIVGILLFGLAIWLNGVDNQVADELRNNFIDISSDVVDTKYNDLLVATNGSISYEKGALDTDLGVSVDSVVLKRNVEVFVWVEEEQHENGQTSYVYKKKWSNELIDSSKFKFQERYENPKKIDYASKSFYASNVHLGLFTLGEANLDSLNKATKLVPDISKKKLPKGYQISGDYISNSKNIDSPEVGDIRISYTYSPDKNISVLAKQKNNTFDYYVTKNKSKVNITLSGIKTGSEIIDGFDKTNYVRNNLFVLASLIFITIGIICFLRKKE